MDALRYGIMARAWYPVQEMEQPRQRLGWTYGEYDPVQEDELMAQSGAVGPMGEFG